MLEKKKKKKYKNTKLGEILSHKYEAVCLCMGTLWIVCAETKHDTTPIGNHQRQGEQPPQQSQSQSEQHQYQQQQQQQQQTNVAYERIRRRSKPLHDESGRWVCDVCGRAYNRGDSLAHHRSIHRGDTICPICQSVFTRKYTMRCHMFNIHGIK